MKLEKKNGKGTFNLPDRLAQRLIDRGRVKAIESKEEVPVEEAIPETETIKPETPEEVIPEVPDVIEPEVIEEPKPEVKEIPAKKVAQKRTTKKTGAKRTKK